MKTRKNKIRVFVSGCYDVIHAGHIEFWRQARTLGDELIVCFASDPVLMLSKNRQPSMPEDNKQAVISSVRWVDKAVKSSDLHPVFDFVRHVGALKPDILAVTDDDKHQAEKAEFCRKQGIKFVVLPKNNSVTRVSTTKILQGISGKQQVPLRVDFAGGWLDVPKFSKPHGYIVNCTISPLVSMDEWPYEKKGGLGGSAAYAILQVKNGVASELKLGVGWQDPAVIEETGLCIWRSGKTPILESKHNPDWLFGRMLIRWLGNDHDTPGLVDRKRDLTKIFLAGTLAAEAVKRADIEKLGRAVNMTYETQLGEGMAKLPDMTGAIAKKYLGGGHGGYALYLFENKAARTRAARQKGTKLIEPYIKPLKL